MVQMMRFPRERVGKALHKAGLSEMPYGYLLRDQRPGGLRGRAYEALMGGAGILVAILVIPLMLVPATAMWDTSGMAQIAASVLLLSLAALLVRNAAQGNLLDTEIDFTLQEARLVRRTSGGQSRIEVRIPFDQVRSVFVRRSKSKASTTNALCLRVAGGDAEYTLMRGSEAAMSTLHRRLVRDINNVVVAGTATAFAAAPGSLELAQATRAAKAGLSAA